MAFCNSCGATLTEGTRFCSKCGAAIAGAPASTSAPIQSAAPAPPTGNKSPLKILLILVAVVVGLSIIGTIAGGIIALHIAKRTHVTREGDHVKVETPFGTAEASKDPEQAAQELGVEIYPGAEVQPHGASSASFGEIHTVTANFESDDPLDKVCAFYKSKFPHATVNTSGQNRCTIAANDPPNVITINIDANGGSSRFQITSVIKNSK